ALRGGAAPQARPVDPLQLAPDALRVAEAPPHLDFRLLPGEPLRHELVHPLLEVEAELGLRVSPEAAPVPDIEGAPPRPAARPRHRAAPAEITRPTASVYRDQRRSSWSSRSRPAAVSR